MRSNIQLIAGLFLMAVGIFTFFLIEKVFASVANGPAPVDISGLGDLLRWGIGGLFTGVGAIYVVSGLAGRARAARQAALGEHIMQNGVDAEATVTFVDKNYSLLVNNRPVYSIVEYTYQDGSGGAYSTRIDDLDSEVVTRNRIQVGARIPIKHSMENPGDSVIVMSDHLHRCSGQGTQPTVNP